MANQDIYDRVQACLDGMSEALQQCMAEEISGEDLWDAIDTQCFALAKLSDANGFDDDDDESDDDDGDDGGELCFDEEETRDGGFDDEDEEN